MLLNSKELKKFLNDIRDNGIIMVSDISDIIERAKKRGINLINNEDLSGIKLVYCPGDKANKNNVRIPKEFLKSKSHTLIGKPLDIDHNRKYVIGHFIDVEYDDTNNYLLAYAVIYKSNFADEWEQIKKMFEKGILTHSFEVWCPIDKREELSDGTYNLLDPTLAGGAILFREKPAHPDSVILELASNKLYLSDVPQNLFKCKNCDQCKGLCETNFIGADLITSPQFIDILTNPKMLKNLSDKELLMEHLRTHQIWNTENGKTVKVLLTHLLIILEMYKRKLNINKNDSLDEKSFEILEDKIKVFSLYNKLPEYIPLKNKIINFVGSVLYKENPNDIDIICNDDNIKNILSLYIDNAHYLSGVIQHGDFWDAYELVLKKNDLKLQNDHEVNYDLKYQTCSIKNTLSLHSNFYVIEPYCNNYNIIIDKENKVIYEVGSYLNNIYITDFLAYRNDNFFNEILANRLYFMYKKWVSKCEKKDHEVIFKYVVKKDNLFYALKNLKSKFDKVIIRPFNSKYYDGKTLIDFNILSNEQFKPLTKFTPLKAKGGAYHELEYFDPEEAWNFFGNYFVKQEGNIKCELKIDGWRCILELDENNKTLIYFEDAKKDRSKNFPSVIKELKEISDNKSIILDGELMETENDTKWYSREDLAIWTSDNPKRNDKDVKIFVFDILYYNNEDLHNKPLSYRWELLLKLAKKFKKHFVLIPSWDIKNKEELIKLYKRYKGNIIDEYTYNLYFKNGIDGFMLKSYSSDYPLNGKTLNWLKLKYQIEINAIVLDKGKTKAGANIYLIGYIIDAKDKDIYTPVKEFNNKYYGVLGKTFATSINVNIGDILGLGMTEIKKKIVDNKIQYTLFQCRVLHERPDLKDPDDVNIIDKLSIEQFTSEILYNSSNYTFYIYEFSESKKPDTGNWTIEEGMHGQGCLQFHIRGITELQKDSIKLNEWKKVGFDFDYFRNIDIKTLNTIYEANWKLAINEAIKGESKTLQKIIDYIYKHIDISKLSEEQKHILSLVDPISVHTDMRLVPDGKDYFEGGHFTQPTNQFHTNELLDLKNHKHVLFMIKQPHAGEWKEKIKEPVIRGDKSWLEVGFPPVWSQPGGVGSTSDKWALFIGIDKFEWYAGIQVSPHGKHFKEFLILNSKILPNGRLIFMFIPIDNNNRIWQAYYPKDQKFKSDFLNKIVKEV